MRNNQNLQTEKLTQTMSMDDNYHQHRPSIIHHGAEHHIDHNHKMGTTILQIVEITESTKDIEMLIAIRTIEA